MHVTGCHPWSSLYWPYLTNYASDEMRNDKVCTMHMCPSLPLLLLGHVRIRRKHRTSTTLLRDATQPDTSATLAQSREVRLRFARIRRTSRRRLCVQRISEGVRTRRPALPLVRGVVWQDGRAKRLCGYPIRWNTVRLLVVGRP